MLEENVIEEEPEAEQAEPAKAAEKEPEPEKDKPNPVQKRIDDLTRAKHEAEREAAFWREAAKPKDTPKPVEKPVKADFDSDDAYIEALTDFKAAQATTKAREELAAEQEKHSRERAQQTVELTYKERAAAFSATVPDFDEVLRSADVGFSKAAGDALFESEHAPAVAYHLATHPEDAKRFSSLTPLAQVRELGRLEERLMTKTPQPITSNAPQPITPNRGSGGQFERDPNKMTAQEYEAWRLKDRPRWAR